MIFFEVKQIESDIYLATRLLMMFYWLTVPSIALIFIWSLYIFPKVNGLKNFSSFGRILPYLKNLSVFSGIILVTAIAVNTLLLIFYAIDTLAIGNYKKYSIYGSYKYSEKPILSFFTVTIMGFILYGILAIVCYQRYWSDYFNFKLNFSLKYWAKKLIFRY